MWNVSYKTTNEGIEPVKLTGNSSRLYITAERVFQEAVLNLNGDSFPELGIPPKRRSHWNVNGYSGENIYGPKEQYQVSDTMIKVEHRVNPNRQRLGDSYLCQHGNYSGSIYPFLSKLANNEPKNEKLLAGYMIRYGRTHQAITLEELKGVCEEANEEDVRSFNQICFLIMEKEQVQWHSATEEKYQLGMAVSQARCLIMIEAGLLRFEEAFKNNVFFGVYSKTRLVKKPGNVKEACKYIDDLYMKYRQSKHWSDCIGLFKNTVIKGSMPTLILTREAAHQDLKYVYGGDSDTDDEGYDTDLEVPGLTG